MALGDQIAKAFVWGQGGAQLTPEQLAMMREQQKNRKNGIDFSPVGHWTQGAGRVAEAIAGAFQRGQLADAEAAAATASQDRMSAWYSPVAEALTGNTVTPEPVVTEPVVVEDLPAQTAPLRSESVAGALSAEPYRDPAVTVVNNAPVPPMDIPNVSQNERLRQGIIETAQAIGADPIDLATAISYETAGTFDPMKKGPRTQWGQHRGLIQFGEPQAKQHGVNWDDPIGSQLGANGAIANYFRASGFKPGMSGLDLYSTINAGAPGLYNRSDANNGGAPGNVRDKWERQMSGHRNKAMALLGDMGGQSAAAALANTPTPTPAPVQANMGGLGNINPQAVMASLMSPYATPQEKQGAQMMIGMYQQQQERQREIQLRQQALQNRQAIAAQMGFDPSFANDEIAFKAMFDKANKDRQTVTVGNNVYDVNNPSQPLITAPDEPTAGQKDYQAYVQYETQNGRTPLGPLEFEQALRKSGAASTNINMGGEKFSEEFGKNDAKLLADVDTAGIQAARNIARIDQLGSMLGNIETGGAASLKQFAGEWGINTEGLSDIQAAQAMVNSLVPEQRQPGSGPMSDADLALFKQSLPRIINTPEGNRTIVNTMRGIAQYDAEGAAIVQQLRSGDIDRTTAFRMLRERQNPLAGFKGSSPQKTQSGPVKISDKSQYDALPSGAEYIAPDGSTRRKP